MGLRHHDTVTGGTTYGWFTVYRATVPPDGVPGFHQRNPRRVSAAGPALRGRIPHPDGGVTDGWETADCAPVYRLQKLSAPDPGRSAVVHPYLPQNLCPPGVQGKANQWIHVLLPVLLAALRALGDAPARSLAALAQRLGVSAADAATVVTPLEEEPAHGGTDPAAEAASPLVPMTGPNGGSSAPKTRLNSKRVIAGRKEITPSKMSCSSMPCSSSSF